MAIRIRKSRPHDKSGPNNDADYGCL
jgi:hypothetical protein